MDFKKSTLTILGGDYRQYLLYESLSAKGYTVKGVALYTKLPKYDLSANSLDNTPLFSPSDYWILGVPFSKDNTLVYTENKRYAITIHSLLDFWHTHPPKMIVGGKLCKQVLDFAVNHQIPCHDLLKYDTLALANAIPTAEGAIFHAIKNSDFTLHGNKCLVLGFGKCGKILADKLQGLHAKVTIYARNAVDRSLANSYGYETISTTELAPSLPHFLFIFNTIPALILTNELLGQLSSTTTVIDIASVPGGVDFSAAKKLNLNVSHCLGLPGKLSPNTAAMILEKQIVSLLQNSSYS